MSTTSTLDLGNSFTVQVTVVPGAAVELTHLDGGKLYRGGHYATNDDRTVEVTAGNIGDCVKAFTVTAAWSGDAPSAAADLAYLNGKKTTVTMTASGYVRLAADASYSSGTEADAANATVVLNFDLNQAGTGIDISVGAYTNAFYRVEPAITDGTRADTGTGSGEDHENDKINVTPESLTLEAQ